jgi:hypothetical protein
MKTHMIIWLLLLLSFACPAQKIKPCDTWLTDFIQIEPKTSEGTPIDKYVIGKLIDDTALKNMATCMVGLRIYSNCNGELSYEKQDYSNNPLLASQCKTLLRKTEAIMKGIKEFAPGRMGKQNKDFIFKLVVRVKRNGKPVAEVLY